MDESSRERLARLGERLVIALLIGLTLYWFLPTFVWHIRRTLDPFTFNDDARILVWPFFRDADARLFPGDPYVPYYLAGLPEGYLALYHLVGRFGWAKATSEVLQYVSVTASVFILAATARRIGGTLAAFVAAALVLGSECFFDRAGGGLPRAFAFPLVSAGLYALVAGRPRLLAGMTIAGAAFYPVVAALLGLTLFFYLVLPPRFRRETDARFPCETDAQFPCETDARNRTHAPSSSPPIRASSWFARARLLAVTLAAVVVLIVPMSLRLRAYGEPIGPTMLREFPEAGLGGRLTRDQHPPFEGFATVLARHTRGALLGTGQPMAGRVATWLRGTEQKTALLLALIVVAGATRLLLAARNEPRLLRPWLLPLAAMLGHAMACLVAPRLFLPERYVQYAIPPLVILLVAGGIGRPAPRPSSRGRRSTPWLAAAFVLAVLGGRGTSWAGIEVHVPPAERPLYAALANLPVNSVIAGWPAGPVENVPYLAERRVLTNFQLEMPFHTGFTLQSRERLRALFEAYFSESAGPIERLCSEFDVTHFLIDLTHFSEFPPDYYAPHRAQLAQLTGVGRRQRALVFAAASRATSQRFGGRYALIELTTVPELAAGCSGRAAP